MSFESKVNIFVDIWWCLSFEFRVNIFVDGVVEVGIPVWSVVNKTSQKWSFTQRVSTYQVYIVPKQRVNTYYVYIVPKQRVSTY